MVKRNRAIHARHQLVILAIGLFELFGASASQAGPALGPAEKFFDPQPAALVRAALANDAARVRELVNAGVDPNSQGPRSESKNTPQITLIGYAVSQRNEAALRLLIEVGANPLFEPRDDDGNVFLFTIVRKDIAMLDALRAWPVTRIPAKTQSRDAYSALGFDCTTCLQVMFKHGVPVGVQDGRGYNLFMAAMSREDFNTAEWLLKDMAIPLDAETVRGVNSANYLQDDLVRYRLGTPTHDRLLRLQAVMQARGVIFPVPTIEQRQQALGVKPL